LQVEFKKSVEGANQQIFQPRWQQKYFFADAAAKKIVANSGYQTSALLSSRACKLPRNFAPNFYHYLMD
jgi:hypothetical protein